MLGLRQIDVCTNSAVSPVEPISAANSSSLREISDIDGQQHGQRQQALSKSQPSGEVSNLKNLPSGWQIPLKQMNATSLSLREIMQEEELLHTNSDKSAVQSGASTWAAKAAQSRLVRNPHNNNLDVSHNARVTNYSGQLSSKSNHNYGELSIPLQDDKDSSNESGISQVSVVDVKSMETTDSLSGNMTQEFSDWCSHQLLKIMGNGDLTLVSFCLTIDSAAEIRETLAANLGSTPQVSQFATEFIRKKEDRANISESGFQKVTKKKVNRR